MAVLPWSNAEVIDIVQRSQNTKSFFLRDNSLERFSFKAGQFITLDLPIDEKPNRRWRSYSIASTPDNTNILELLIVLNESGKGTPYLFNDINVGDSLTYRGPLGVFTLPEDVATDLYFICTGTGVAPFRSMLYNLLNNGYSHQLHLIFGSRTKADLMYFDELVALTEKHPNFHYYPVLSREIWEGRTGYVHMVYEKLCENKPEGLFYICGWKNMIDDAKNKLLAFGYDKKAIHFELYG